MHITNIIAEDFRNIESCELTDLPKTIALFGWNGQGKTSLENAIQMALFGFCKHTQRNGNGFQCLIREGADVAHISIDLTQDDHEYTILVKLPRKGSREWSCVDTATGKSVTGVISPETFWHIHGIDMRQALVAGMPRAFLHSKELGDLLSELLAGDIDVDTIMDAAGDHADWLGAFAKKNHANLATASGLKALGDAAFAKRTEYNRDLKSGKAVLEDMSQTTAPKDSKKKKRTLDDLPGVLAALQGCVSARDALQRKLGAAENGRSADDIDADKKKVKKQLEELTAKNRKADDEIIAIHKKLEIAEKEFEHHAGRGIEIEKLLIDIEKSPKAGDACPTCQRTFSEAAAKKATKGLLDSATLLKEKEALAGKVEKAEAAVVELREKKATLMDREAETPYAERLRALDNETPAGDPQALQAEINALAERIARGQELVEKLNAFDEYTRHVAYLDRLQEDIAELDWAVKSFRDGEITKSFMSDGAEDFEKRCNVRLEAFGYKISVKAEGKKVEMLLTWKEKSGIQYTIPISKVSQGQQAITEMAIAYAFAETGAPVILDDTNEMDGNYRRILLTDAKENDCGSVFIAAAWQQASADMAPKAKALDPIQVIWVEEGTYQQITTDGKGAK